ncbi:PREDICTED: UDP-xylose and UDP-N-acetylglucosamine transporter-like [Papilio polytes]|uniref:UDP-xylose and UDP-N-acetylglucosamine transporter-like n=1 Tax=Papilio polytes TaxID=76194 RepID=UPI00067656F5|nr:PREDICTED: UDP-xylose and UDP-N-acetylglucosamine transporter-like [Papilio polytes]
MGLKNTTFNVFLSCCVNSFLMEILMAKAPECANFVTFLQFLFISIQGFLFRTFNVFNPNIPFKSYFILIALFFVTSVANNYVYALHVPSTLHMIIRSASSPASMLVSWYAKNRVPKLTAIIGSILISMGVALAMYGGATVVENNGTFIHWCFGIVILLSTLILGAFTGLQQEILYSSYGKHPDEMLFFTHCIPLPLFLTIYLQLKNIAFSMSSYLWLILALNIVSQFFCAHSVHDLATKENSVTVTFILTIRKFISLLLSSVVFKNNLTILHVFGTILVVVGTYIYFDCFKSKKQRPVSLKND